MTTTRINHTGHAHANTTAARTICRNEIRATTARIAAHYAANPVVPGFTMVSVGKGRAIHLGVTNSLGVVFGVRCGAGLTRNGNDSDYRTVGRDTLDAVTCRSCRNKYGQAHG